MAAKFDKVIYVKCSSRLHQRLHAILGDDEDASMLVRAAVDREVTRRERDALRAQSDARTGSVTGRAPLEPYDAPEPSKDRK